MLSRGQRNNIRQEGIEAFNKYIDYPDTIPQNINPYNDVKLGGSEERGEWFQGWRSRREYLQHGKPIVYHTDRNEILTHTGEPSDVPILCCGLAQKWYTFWLINPDGSVVSYELQDVAYIDNLWNPNEIVKHCFNNNYELCPLTHELLIGRWEVEYIKGEYLNVYGD